VLSKHFSGKDGSAPLEKIGPYAYDQIPKLSRPYSVFKDFPGPGKIDNCFQGLAKTFKAVWPP